MQKFKPVIYLILAIEWLVLQYFGPGQLQGQILSISLFLFSLYQVFNSIAHRQIWLGVMFFFMLSYAYEPVRYFCYGDSISYWRRLCQNPSTVYNVAQCIYLFQLAMCFFIDYRRAKPVYRTPPIEFRADIVLWLACLALGVWLTVIGKTGENMFVSGAYARASQNSPTFEYAQIPLIVALCYSNTRDRKIITLCTIALYVLKDLLYGGRIETVMIALLVYMVLLRHKFSLQQTIIVVFFGFFLLTFWGGLRHDATQEAGYVASRAWAELDLSTGNSQDVYYASMRILYMIDHGILTAAKRLESFYYFMLSSVVPYSKLPDLAGLSGYLSQKLHTGGGGLAPVFIYAWLGYFGVFAVGVLIGKLLTSIIRGTCGKYLFMYGIFLVAFVPRWYAYYPVTLIKLCVYATLFFVITESIRTRKLPFVRS